MTYLVATKFDGVSCIIADTRVTFDHRTGHNGALKVGKLIPGCLYGISGYKEPAAQLIHSIRSGVARKSGASALWTGLNEIVEQHCFDSRYPFELILSSRYSGTPRLYRLSSSVGRVEEVVERTITTGTGTELLDAGLKEFESTTFLGMWDQKRAHGVPERIFPHLYCLWLTERTRGHEVSVLEKHGVGGVFHFCWQDRRGEYAQGPSVYLLASQGHPKPVVYGFRAARYPSALLIDDPVAGSAVIFDDLAKPDGDTRPGQGQDIEELAKKIVEQDRAGQHYEFCGIGNPESRRCFYAMQLAKSEKDCFPRDGQVLESENGRKLTAFLEHMLSLTHPTASFGDPHVQVGPTEDTRVQEEELSSFSGCPGFVGQVRCWLDPVNIGPPVFDRVLLEVQAGKPRQRIRLYVDVAGRIAFGFSKGPTLTAAVRGEAIQKGQTTIQFGILSNHGNTLFFVRDERCHV